MLVGRSISSLHPLQHRHRRDVADRAWSIGWRIRGSFADAVLAYVLLLLWGFAMIWVGILVGSALRSVEAVQG